MDAVLYRRPRYLALTLLMIVALGAAALQSIGRQEDPTITNLFATVVAPYPGASPERVEALVTEKIEAELREIPEIDELSSTSRTGVASVRIELSDRISEERIEQVWSEIRDALSDAAVEMPPDAPEPAFDNDRTGAFTAIIALTARDGVALDPAQAIQSDASMALLSRYGRELRDTLRQLSGAKLVRAFGAAEEEIRVEIDPDRLASVGLTVDDVARAVARADAKMQAGRVRGPRSDFLIEVAGEIDSVERVRRIPLAEGAAGGRLLRLGDVAEVRRARIDPPDSLARSNGARAVLIAAKMEDDLQVDAFMDRLRDRFARFKETLPDGLKAELVFDQSAYTAARLSEVAGNLGLGVALVVGVLFLAMGWRAAVVVAVMLPLTSLLSLFVLERVGVVIHQMSVTGLIVALGLLVDAAIVMTDEIRKRITEGVARLEAVRGAVRRLAAPLFASTATTILAFTPMALLPGPAGDFVGAIAIAVIVMLSASFLLALTVTPALAGFLLPDAGAEARRTWWRDGIGLGAVARLFDGALALALRERGLAMMAAATLPVVGFLSFPTLTAQFFPGVDRDQFYVQVELPDGAAIAETRRAVDGVDAALRGHPEVRAVQWVVGKSAPSFYYNMQMTRDVAPGFAEALVTTRSAAATERAIPDLQRRLDAAAPEAQILVRGLVQGPPVAAPLELRLVGPSLSELRRLGEEARRRLSELPTVTHTQADLSGGAPKLVFDLDEDKVRLAGMELGDAARQLETLLEGAIGGSLVEGGEELPVRVRVGAETRSDAARIADLRLQAAAPRPGGAADETGAEGGASSALPGAPLAALGDLRLEPSESTIARKDGERVNDVRAYLQRGVLPEEALSAFRDRLAADPIVLPPGYRIEWGGDSDARSETVTNLVSTLGLVVALSVAAVVLTFNSWRLSMIAFVVCGLSMGLSLLALAVFQYPFGVQALIGVIGSIGVSINAAIIIMTALQEDDDAARGDPDAIRRVVGRSSRHIVSTTVTTFGGFLPLILAGGGFWPPFAMAIAGGVLLSTVVSFFFVPPAYSALVGRPRALGERRAEPAAPTAPTSAVA